MNFDFDDDQRTMQDVARSVLSTAAGADQATIRSTLQDLGWLGAAVPERLGGTDLGHVELAILCEEAGRALVPFPLSHHLAATAALRTSDDPEAERYLRAAAQGTATFSIVTSDLRGRQRVAGPADDALVLDHDAVLVVDVRTATRTSNVDATIGYAEVPAAAPGVRLRTRDAQDIGRLLHTAEMVGAADAMLDRAVDYAREREQFGAKIGSFQAVAHRCVDMLREVECARWLTYRAAWTADDDRDALPLAVAVAQAYGARAGRNVAAGCLQVHGGVGFTWEHDTHRYLKRLLMASSWDGGARAQRGRIGRMLLAEDPAEAVAGNRS